MWLFRGYLDCLQTFLPALSCPLQIFSGVSPHFPSSHDYLPGGRSPSLHSICFRTHAQKIVEQRPPFIPLISRLQPNLGTRHLQRSENFLTLRSPDFLFLFEYILAFDFFFFFNMSYLRHGTYVFLSSCLQCPDTQGLIDRYLIRIELFGSMQQKKC